MEQSFKSIMTFVGIMLIYILLASFGVYNVLGIMLFPILSIPLAIALIKNKSVFGVDLLFNIPIIIGIYLLTGRFESVFVYVVAVGVPAYAIAFFYKKNELLPNTIMYLLIIVVIAVFIYLTLMKYLQVDYEMQFILFIDEVKAEYIKDDSIQRMVQAIMQSPITPNALQESIMKESIALNMEIIKGLYPALILSLGVFLTSIQVALLNSVLKSKDIKRHGLTQLLNFKLSKIALVILFIAMLMAAYSNNMSSTITIVSMNVLFFLRTLMMIMGVLSFAVMLKKSTINGALKVLGYIMLAMLLILPNILVLFGCLDTIYNFRKAEIIV